MESDAHFKLELGGQYHWNLQSDSPNGSVGTIIAGVSTIYQVKHLTTRTIPSANNI